MLPVTVVVPVLQRPQNAQPFMASLRASSQGVVELPVIAVVNGDDEHTARAWRRAGSDPLWCDEPPGSFGQKANLAVDSVHTDWMFLVGDDVAFHPGWLEAALLDVGDHVCVVGTNDLANPRVTAGDHAVHMFLRMDYVRERGASWDGPGTVCGPYRHWFCDDEIVTVAKLRDVWTHRGGSVVEHLHPYFGKGEMDDVYRLGESEAAADQALWMSRVERFAPELLPH